MTVVTIPNYVSFLDELAAQWFQQVAKEKFQRIHHGTIIVPNHRSARSLVESFLRLSVGKPILLPRIIPLNFLEETNPVLEGVDNLALPPSVSAIQRLSVLSRFIQAGSKNLGDNFTLEQAWQLATSLADLMDESELFDCALEKKLPDAVEVEFAEHWKIILSFLEVVTSVWPNWLENQGMVNPVARYVAMLRRQIREWQQNPPIYSVWASGFISANPVTVELLQCICCLKGGHVILPGLDTDLADSIWVTLPDTHPQAAFRQILQNMDISRNDVEIWNRQGVDSVLEQRASTISSVMLPAQWLSHWQKMPCFGLPGIMRLESPDQQKEAADIALIMRDVIETPGRRIALVTSDRHLARRVVAELSRWNIVADDSAGYELIQTPVAVFLRLVMGAVSDGLRPVALLSMLKHPLAACSLATKECRHLCRLLERYTLRGPVLARGIENLRLLLKEKQHKQGDRQERKADIAPLLDFLDRLDYCLEPLVKIDLSEHTFSSVMSIVIQAAERLAETPSLSGEERLWADEEGHMVARHIADLIRYGDILLPETLQNVGDLFHVSMLGQRMEGRRTLRGRENWRLHPRVFIWGLLEARLQSVDVMILGGMVETIWPQTPDSGPWINRSMRSRIGMPQPEQKIGETAHDFVSCLMAAKEVILSCPIRREGVPMVPSRWIVRLEAFLRAHHHCLATHPVGLWRRQMDFPLLLSSSPARRPLPCPPVHFRPHRMSVVGMENWLANPYKIYARYILDLKEIDPLEQDADARDFGNIVHQAIAKIMKYYPRDWPRQAAFDLCTALDDELKKRPYIRPSLVIWWRNRFVNIAEDLWEYENKRRRDKGAPSDLFCELEGSIKFPIEGLATPFKLVGRADRIEISLDGGICIIDYKTGDLPPLSDIQNGSTPQLLLEAVIAAMGGFPKIPSKLPVQELSYIKLTGDHTHSLVRILDVDNHANMKDLIQRLPKLLVDFLTQYTRADQPFPFQATFIRKPGDLYAQLARTDEWAHGENS